MSMSRWAREASRAACDIVKLVIQEQPNPVKVHDLYKLSLQKPSAPLGESGSMKTSGGTVAPVNDHAIRSMRCCSSRLALPT